MRRPERDATAPLPLDALAWVCEQGMVLQSALGPVPNLAEFVVGAPIRVSWWGHPASHEIYAVLPEVVGSPNVARTRLINSHVTPIHRRLWPALVRTADHFSPSQLTVVEDVHTTTGTHRTTQIPFPDWVPVEDVATGPNLSLEEALEMLPACLR
jgi:hypothetical protein